MQAFYELWNQGHSKVFQPLPQPQPQRQPQTHCWKTAGASRAFPKQCPNPVCHQWLSLCLFPV